MEFDWIVAEANFGGAGLQTLVSSGIRSRR